MANTFGVLFDGRYELSTRTGSGYVSINNATGLLAGASIWVANSGWSRRVDEKGDFADDCWTPYSSADLATSDDPLTAAPLGFPAAIDVLLSGEGRLKTGNEIRAEVDLYRLARVYGGQLSEDLGIPRRGAGKGTIVVHVRDGAVTGWRNTTVNFLHEAEAAGYSLPPEFQGYESSGSAFGVVQVELQQLGDAEVADPPPPVELC